MPVEYELLRVEELGRKGRVRLTLKSREGKRIQRTLSPRMGAGWFAFTLKEPFRFLIVEDGVPANGMYWGYQVFDLKVSVLVRLCSLLPKIRPLASQQEPLSHEEKLKWFKYLADREGIDLAEVGA